MQSPRLATIDPRSMTGRHALFADTSLPSTGVVQVHTPAMDVDFDFSWAQFLWGVYIFVGVPPRSVPASSGLPCGPSRPDCDTPQAVTVRPKHIRAVAG